MSNEGLALGGTDKRGLFVRGGKNQRCRSHRQAQFVRATYARFTLPTATKYRSRELSFSPSIFMASPS